MGQRWPNNQATSGPTEDANVGQTSFCLVGPTLAQRLSWINVGSPVAHLWWANVGPTLAQPWPPGGRQPQICYNYTKICLLFKLIFKIWDPSDSGSLKLCRTIFMQVYPTQTNGRTNSALVSSLAIYILYIMVFRSYKSYKTRTIYV